MSLDNEEMNTMSQNEVKDDEFGQEIEDAEELRQKKEDDRFHIAGNLATTQIFINNLDSFNWKGISKTEEYTSKVQTYDLNKQDECIEFIEKNQNTEHLMIALILSVFDRVALSDLVYLKQGLGEFLITYGNSEKMDNKPFFSVNSILEVIGGQKFKTADGKIWLSMKNGSELALGNIIEQFPELKDIIVHWLVNVGNADIEETSFDIYQLAMAFERIVKLDLDMAEKYIFPLLYEHTHNSALLGLLIYWMYRNKESKEVASRQLQYVIQREQSWEWKIACIVYSYFVENEEGFAYEGQTKSLLRRKIVTGRREDYMFISMLMIQSRGFRTVITEIYNMTYKKAMQRSEQEQIACSYIKLVRISYYQISKIQIELPLIACDSYKQQENIQLVLNMVINTYSLRKQLYAILKAYMNEISNYVVARRSVRHIAAFFYNLLQVDSDYREDILEFLETCRSKVAKEVYAYIFENK